MAATRSRSATSSPPPADAPAPETAEGGTTLSPPSGLHGKLALVLGEMGRVAKTGWNDAQRYHFAQEGDIADMVRASLAAHGVSFHVDMPVPPIHEEIRSRSGTVGDRCTIQLTFTLRDADNPSDAVDSTWWAHADDYQDKSIGKAITAAKKSWLVAQFLISTGDQEPDAVGEQRAAAEPEPAPRPITDTDRRRMFALGRELGIEPEFVRLTARLLTRDHAHPHGVSLGEYDRQQLAALEASLRAWETRPAGHDERMGKLAAALAEQAEQTAQAAQEAKEAAEAAQAQDAAEAPQTPAEAPPEPEEHQLTCTCGKGPDVPPVEHDESCPLSIPF